MFSQLIGSPQRQEALIQGPDGILLSTVAWGNPHAAHQVLCVHGGWQAKETFREQYEALAGADCHVIGFDLPWHGRSGPTPGQSHLVPTLPLLAESLAAVRHHYQLSASVVLLAWSLGGLIVREYLCGQAPPAIGGLVFVAPLLDMQEGMAAWQAFRPNTLTIVEEMGQESTFSGRAQAFLRFVGMLSEKPADYYTLGYNSLSFLKTGTSLSRMLAGLSAGNADAFLGRVDCPVMFVQGTKDELLPAEYTRSNVARIRQGKLIELPCGHSPHLEMPLAFNTAVYDFLQSLSHSAATVPLLGEQL